MSRPIVKALQVRGTRFSYGGNAGSHPVRNSPEPARVRAHGPGAARPSAARCASSTCLKGTCGQGLVSGPVRPLPAPQSASLRGAGRRKTRGRPPRRRGGFASPGKRREGR